MRWNVGGNEEGVKGNRKVEGREKDRQRDRRKKINQFCNTRYRDENKIG